ncbi:MAG: sugar phosphate isomerase/epimerase family protein [Bacteroidota bacterium]
MNRRYLLNGLSLFFLVVISSCTSKPDEKSTVDTIIKEDNGLQISLAQWSLHKTFFGGPVEDWGRFGRLIKTYPDSLLQGEDPMNFPKMAADYGVNTIELVNVFYYGKANDKAYWEEFKNKCKDAGVSVGLIMCDRLGNLGDPDSLARAQAVKNHHIWVDIAEFLGASAIRVNAAGKGTEEEVAASAEAGLKSLANYASSKNINVIVENHGGYSSNGKWLAGVIDKVGLENVGTLPDFGNFCLKRGDGGCIREYDRYQGMAEIMPFAKGVSAKSHEFDLDGNEVHTDFTKMIEIVKQAGFSGYIGIEFEGNDLSEDEGIKATKALLEKVLESNS